MTTAYLYPGSFNPPTYGHLCLVRRAVEVFPATTILCSVNQNKTGQWFTPDMAKQLWQSYDLPEGVDIWTFDEFLTKRFDASGIIMIRGLRNEADAEEEKKVMLHNHKHYGIDRFFHIFCGESDNISSTRARNAAQDLDWFGLRECVSPLVVSVLLEKALQLSNLFLVVGPPGGGKSTFLKKVKERHDRTVHINTDRFIFELAPEIVAHFGHDYVWTALENEEEVKIFVTPLWLAKLKEALAVVPAGSDVFVEIAYAMQADKELFRMLGGKIIYVDCGNVEENLRRITARGTPQHIRFIDRIPGWKETVDIATKNRLSLMRIDTSDNLAVLDKDVERFCETLKGDSHVC